MTDKKIPAGGQPAGGTTGANFDNRTEASIAQSGAGGKLDFDVEEMYRTGQALKDGAGVDDALQPILKKQWKLRTLTDAYKPRDPLVYVVDRLFSLPSLSIVYGAPGSLKSMVLADAAVCVAAGLPWLDPLPTANNTGVTLSTTRAAVLWIDFDNGTRRTDERFDALAKSRNLPPDIPLHYVSLPDPWLDASNKEIVFQVSLLALSLGVKFIIVDNLGLISGDVEENSAQMAGVMGNLRWLAESTGAAVVVIHHQRKSGNGDGKIRRGESLRGHSSIEAALDLALLVERKQGTEDISIVPTKERGATLPTLAAQFTYQHVPLSTDLATAKFWAITLETKDEKTNGVIRAEILLQLERYRGGDAPTQAALVADVRDNLALQIIPVPGVNKVRGLLAKMVIDREVNEEADGNGKAKRYVLP
mgnify:CR=1 FL=1